MEHSLHLALRRALISIPPSLSRSSRSLASAATATAPSPARAPTRSTYSRVKPTTSTSSTATTVKRVTPTTRTSTSPSVETAQPLVSTTSSSDLAALVALEEENFPSPDPSSVLPDYAKLAPALDVTLPPTTRRSSIPTPQPTVGIEGEEPISEHNDWSNSFHGLSAKPFKKEIAERLMRPLEVKDVEIKPDGLLYLPEIKYRRTLNEAFGPGGWGLAPRGETNVGPRIVSREWGLVCLGRLVAIARGEQEYFDPSGVPTATEACKSNALMRCCKDLGIASELWDPSFIREFKAKHCVEAFVEHVVQKKKRKLWRKKDAKFEYPYKET